MVYTIIHDVNINQGRPNLLPLPQEEGALVVGAMCFYVISSAPKVRSVDFSVFSVASILVASNDPSHMENGQI
jgi:hypothetical protein